MAYKTKWKKKMKALFHNFLDFTYLKIFTKCPETQHWSPSLYRESQRAKVDCLWWNQFPIVQTKSTKQFWLLELEFQASKLLNNEVECLNPIVLWCYRDTLYWVDATWLRSLESDHQNTSKAFLISWSFPQDEINDPSRSLKLPLKTEKIWGYSDIPCSRVTVCVTFAPLGPSPS